MTLSFYLGVDLTFIYPVALQFVKFNVNPCPCLWS